MRKALLIILALFTAASLGHDIYLYQQAPQKGFAFAAIGNLWSKYHPETFTQWKVKTEEVSKQIENVKKDVVETTSILLPLPENDEAVKTQDKPKAPYEESFAQNDSKEGTARITQIRRQKNEDENASAIKKAISVILAQKATLLLGAITLFIFIIGWVFGRLRTIKENAGMPKKGKLIKQQQRKGGGYKYGRK